MPNFIDTDPSGDSLSVQVDRSGAVGVRFDGYGRRRNGTTPKPSVLKGAGTGTGGSATIAGTDEFGVVTVVTGTTSVAGILATVTFSTPFAVAPTVFVSCGDADSAAAQVYATSTASTLVIRSVTPADAKTYKISYWAVGGA